MEDIHSTPPAVDNGSQNGGSAVDDDRSGVPDIIPMQDYNIKKAKLKASLRWMVARAYNQYDPPPDLKDPFFRDAEGEDHLKPSVIYQLASSELYSMACTNVFSPNGQQWQGHWNIIQGLSRKGVYVLDEKDEPVTETTLAQTQRIKLTAHLAMMDSIQKAYVTDVTSIEKVVQAVRQIATFSASSELPFDREDALLFWINKVCGVVNHQMVKDRKGQQDSLMQSSPQKVRLRREQLKSLPSIPVMDDVMKDLGDGCCLAVLLHYYCPHLVSLDDLSLQDPMSFADSIHNLNIIEEFFQKYLPTLYPFKSEDLLYSPSCLKANIVAMLAQLFHTFEVAKPEHLQDDQEKVSKVIHVSDGISAKLPPLPISSATKKSFHNDLTTNLLKNEMRNASSNPELNKIGSATTGGQPQLLTKRRKQVQSSFQLGHDDEDSLQSQLRRATSLDNMDVGKRSFVAWQKPTELRPDGRLNSASTQSSFADRSSLRDSHGSSLLTNVSLDSELGQSMNIDELGALSRSHNDQTNNNQEVIAEPQESRPETYTMSEYADEDDLEVESLTSALSRVSRASENVVQPSHANSLEGPPPAVTGLGHQKAQLNGASDLYEPRQSQNEHLRTESAAVQSSYASDSGQPGFTLGGGGGGVDGEQLDTSCNRKKLSLDIQPVPMGQSRGGISRQQERLMPAVVKPLKEKSHNANKQDERGVLGRSPRHNVEPSAAKMASWGSGGQPNSNNDLSPDLESTTPESMADSLASDFSMRSKGNSQKGQFRVPFQPLNQNVSQAPQVSKAKHGEAFYIHSDMTNDSVQGSSSSSSSSPKPASSFTIIDKSYTLETAQQAGIPVVQSMEAEMQRSLQHSQQQMMDSGRSRGESPRLSQSNTYSHSYPHANHHANPNAYPDPHANPNHMPMHNPHMHSYSPSHSQTPPPPPPYGSPHYPNPQYTDPRHSTPHHANPHYANPHHANPHHANPYHANPYQPTHPTNTNHPRSSPQYSSPHASPQPVLHGNFHSNSQNTGGGGSVTSGRSELTRFGNPGMETSVSLSPPHHYGDKESPKLHADQTERESPFRPPVLLTFDTNLSPENTLESPEFNVIPNIDQGQLHALTNPIDYPQVDAITNHRNSPVDIHLSKSNPQLRDPVQMDEDPLDDLTQANLIAHNSMPDKADYMTNPRKMTTWVSRSKHAPHINTINTGHGTAPSYQDNREPLQIGLTQVRLRLEEKRRNMEKEKRHLERHWTKQRQRVGKAAFMQVLAIQKRAKENDNVVGNVSPEGTLGRGVNKPYSRDEIERSLQEAQSRWLQEQGHNQPGKTTFAALSAANKTSSSGSSQSRDSDSPRTHSESPVSVREVGGRGSPGSSSGSHSPPQLTADQYNTSLDKMNENMSQLMKEIQKLTVQQEQLKSAVESPRQKADADHRQTPVSAEPEPPGFVLHGSRGNTPSSDYQPFYLGKQASPTSEPDNEPFMLQENPLFTEQMSPPASTPQGPCGQTFVKAEMPSPRGQLGSEAKSPGDNYNTYCVAKPKTRPKLDLDQETLDNSESLANKRGQQVTPIETNNLAQSLGSEAPLSTDDLNRSPQQQGFRLHVNEDAGNEEDTPVVQANTYRKPVGFDIVDDSKPTPRTNRKDATPFQPPKLKSDRTPRLRTSSGGSSPTKKRPPSVSSVYEIVGETENDNGMVVEVEPLVVRPLEESGQEVNDSGDSKVLGFVIEQDKSEEDEIAKKREQFLRSRLKKQEGEKAKKERREAAAEKLKEQQRIKQEEIELKKAKEIERREKIRIAYQKKKQQEQDEQDGGPAPVARRAVKKSRPRSRVIVDDNTDYAKPTISSGPPAVSAQDVANANMDMRQQKSSFTISNGQPDRNGGGAASSVSSGQSTPPKSSPQTPGPITAPAGLTSNSINKATSPADKPPSKPSGIPEAVKRRPPSPRVRPRQSKNKPGESSPTKPEVPSSEGSNTAPPSIVSQDSNDSSGGSASTNDYSGPKLYVKPASKSNRHIITNAIAHVVLAGTVNQNTKDKVLMEVAKSEYKHFVILFRNHGLQFRGLYGYCPDGDEITKFYGTGPRHITPKMIEALYKYNSGDKSFSRIPSKTMSVQIDAVTIANHLWQAKKPSAKKH